MIKSLELQVSAECPPDPDAPEISEVLKVMSRRHTRQKGPSQPVVTLDYRIGKRVYSSIACQLGTSNFSVSHFPHLCNGSNSTHFIGT